MKSRDKNELIIMVICITVLLLISIIKYKSIDNREEKIIKEEYAMEDNNTTEIDESDMEISVKLALESLFYDLDDEELESINGLLLANTSIDSKIYINKLILQCRGMYSLGYRLNGIRVKSDTDKINVYLNLYKGNNDLKYLLLLYTNGDKITGYKNFKRVRHY